MNKLNSETKLYITIPAIILIFIVTIFGVIRPLVKKIDSLSAEYLDTRQKITDTEAKRNQFAKMEKEYDKIKDRVAKIDFSLIDPEKFLDIVIQLEQAAENAGNRHEITILEISKKETSSQLKYLPFRIVLYGTFQNALNFINNLENAGFYNKIEKIEMVKLESVTSQQLAQGAKEGDIKTTMEIKIFTR